MSSTKTTYSTVTAVLPTTRSGAVIDDVKSKPGASALMWRGRGTLLQDHWWQRWVPPISPAKTMLQMLVPDHAVSDVIDSVVTKGRLHQQATGAVFSVPCDNVCFGTEYHHWPNSSSDTADPSSFSLEQELGIIYCIVSQSRSDRVCRAAINAGAHGPIVHYCEGRGLRDRLGWLRITKEHDQEVLIVLTDRKHVDGVFEAMAKAGEFHRPGRGLMYRMPVDHGMVNLHSRISTQNYDANMQQIIRAIDHLSGHAHWRDNALGEATNKSALSDSSKGGVNKALHDQKRLSAIVRRSQADVFSDLALDAGVPGLTVVQTFFSAGEEGCKVAEARVNDEYALYRCILNPKDAHRIRDVIEDTAEERGINDFCVYTNSIPRVARYVAGSKDYRVSGKPAVQESSREAVQEA